MKLRNTTTVSDRAIRDVIAFVRPSGLGGFTVKVQNHRNGNFGLAKIDHNAVLIRLPEGPQTKRNGYRRVGYLPLPVMMGRMEWLVYLAAHELRHLWQARIPRGRRVWGSRGQFSERDACAYGIRMLRAWRRGEQS